MFHFSHVYKQSLGGLVLSVKYFSHCEYLHGSAAAPGGGGGVCVDMKHAAVVCSRQALLLLILMMSRDYEGIYS